MQKYHLISGLPRSGSTLLSSILKQNPRFHADISDPLLDYCRGIVDITHRGVGMEVSVPTEKRADLIRGLFRSFYNARPEVCFNTNRAWTAQSSMVRQLFPDTKIIACIRDVPWILDSFEQLNARNPFAIKALFDHQDLPTVYHRAAHLMRDNGGGYVSGPLLCLKQALYSNEKDMICVVDYDALAKRPKETMQRIYQFIQEPWFEHDFDNVEDSYDEFDEKTNFQGLHTIRKRVEYKQRRPILPEDAWQNWMTHSFWRYNFEHIKRQIYWIE